MDQHEEKILKIEPDAVYIKMFVDRHNNLNSELWMETSNFDLAAVVRGMLARLEIDQEEWYEVGEFILNREAKNIKDMMTKGNS